MITQSYDCDDLSKKVLLIRDTSRTIAGRGRIVSSIRSGGQINTALFRVPESPDFEERESLG